ncbi:LuxR C-terminal-related transcriptional regulator [Chloroflexota bacterium]
MKRIKVLIADRYPAFREGLSCVLSDEDDIDVVASVDDAHQAVKLAEEIVPDVIFVDFNINGSDGIEVINKVKEACPRAAVIIMDKNDSEPNMLISLRAGAAAYLLKESSLVDLVRSVRIVQSGNSVFDAKTSSKILQRVAAVSDFKGENIVKLRHRELEVLHLAAKGMHNNEIAEELFISQRTVQTHLKQIFTRLSVCSRTEAVIYALREGWLSIDDLS